MRSWAAYYFSYSRGGKSGEGGGFMARLAEFLGAEQVEGGWDEVGCGLFV